MSETLSEECLRVFLDHLAETSNVSAAAKRAKVSRAAVYRLRAVDAAFSNGWQTAIATGYAELELKMLKRARFGTLKPFKRPDGTLGRAVDYDDAHGLKLLTAYKASVEKGQCDIVGDVTSAAAARDALAATLAHIRKRLDDAVGVRNSADSAVELPQ